MKRAFFFIYAVLLCLSMHGQNNDEFIDRAGFDEFRSSMYNNYYNFRRQIMKEYVDFVRKAWSEFEGLEPVPAPEERPLPPVIKPDDENIEPVAFCPVLIDEIIAPLPLTPQPEPVVPIDEVPMLKEKFVYFSFFGTDAKVRFDVADRVHVAGTDENAVADALEKMAEKNHDNMILDCLFLRKELQLSDWAYLQMLDALAKKIYGNDVNGKAVLAAYLYMQSGYKVRIGSDDKRLYMLFACDGFIYERVAFYVGDCRFYGLEPLPSRMSICEASLKNEKNLSLVVAGGQRFAYKNSEPRRIVSADYPGISAEVSVNENLLDFYSTYPTSMIGDNLLSRWAFYANTPLDKGVARSLYPKLAELVQGLSEIEAANRLLNFVQTGLVYEYDNTVWGYDRVFFSEESLFYPFCDCEDRSILFSRFVRDLLGLDVVLVAVPGHMLTAVNFNEEADGYYTMVNGKKYVLCEPTCLTGAKVGWANIEDGTNMQVILLERDESMKDYREKILAKEVERSLFPVCVEGKWGYKNCDGEIVVECKYDRVSDNARYGDKHLYVAESAGKLELYDSDGCLNCRCDGYIPLDLNRIHGGKMDYYFIFKSGGHWYMNDLLALIEPDGVSLDEYDMENVTYENNIFCHLPAENSRMERYIILKRKADGKWGIIDEFGNVNKVPFEYDRITFLPGDKSKVKLLDAKTGKETIRDLLK